MVMLEGKQDSERNIAKKLSACQASHRNKTIALQKLQSAIKGFSLRVLQLPITLLITNLISVVCVLDQGFRLQEQAVDAQIHTISDGSHP